MTLDPLPERTQVWRCRNLGTAFAQFEQMVYWAYSSYNAHPEWGWGGPPSTDIVEWNGHVAMRVILPGPDATDYELYEACDTPYASGCSVEQFARQPYINGMGITTRYDYIGDYAEWLPDAVNDSFDKVMAFLAIQAGWSGDFENEVTLPISYYQGVFTRAVCIYDNAKVHVCVHQSTFPTGETPFGQDSFEDWTAAPDAVASTAPYSPTLVRAVQQLAQQDVDVSINHGSAIYSVRSAEVTEP